MTNEQFSAIAKMIKSGGGVSEKGARIALVEGKPVKEVADDLGCTRQAINKCIRRFKEAFEDSKAVHQ